MSLSKWEWTEKFTMDLWKGRLSLDEIESRISEVFKGKNCEVCGQSLHEAKADRIPYTGFLIHIIRCPFCKNEALRFYTSLGTMVVKYRSMSDPESGWRYAKKVEVVAVGTAQHGANVTFKRIAGISYFGSPIRTSRDYKDEDEKIKGRPRKYDRRVADHEIWEFLGVAPTRVKYGFDTESVYRKVNQAFGRSYSRKFVLSRLKDMDLRGLIKGTMRKLGGGKWQWFWERVRFGELPHNYFVYPEHTPKFTDADLFPWDVGEEFWEAWNKAKAKAKREAKRENTPTKTISD